MARPVALAAILALAGCGSGGESITPTPTPTPTPSPAPGADPADPTIINPPVDPASDVITVDAALVGVGRIARLDLRGAGRLAGLDGLRTRYEVTFSPDANGLVANGPIVTGTPIGVHPVVATIVATDPAGVRHEQTVRIGAVRTSTTGAPRADLLNIDYLADPLPFVYTNPVPTDPAGELIAADNSPADNTATNAGIALGRALFYDTRLSFNGTVACASCHVQALGFSDPRKLSRGIFDLTTSRHSMGLTDVRFRADGRMFWDAHSLSLEEQALEPILNQREMGHSPAGVVLALQRTGVYGPMFAAAFGTPDISQARIGRALAQFQRQLVSGRSRYDQAVGSGDFGSVFTKQELLGRALFEPVPAAELAAQGLPAVESLGCSTCHRTAAQLGGTSRVGAGPGADTGADNGTDVPPATMNVGLDLDPADKGGSGRGDFKVPSLRNVARTAPYMHDGRFRTLDETVRFFAEGVIDTPNTTRFLREGHQDGAPIRRRKLSDDEVAALVAFLGTLTDESLLSDARFADPFDVTPGR